MLPLVITVREWWGEKSLARWLYIPKSKQDEIRTTIQDETRQKEEAISYWISHDPLASWRRLITALERSTRIKLDRSILSKAEPLTG